jgi:hypothetical protein
LDLPAASLGGPIRRTGDGAGSALSSRVSPRATTAPLAITTYSSASRWAKSTYCSTRRTVTPRSARIRWMASSISSMMDGWMPSVGSSSTRRRGPVRSARPMASICCSPPDSTPPFWSGWPPSSRRPGDRCSRITGCWRRDPDGEPRLSRRPPLTPRGRTRRRASRDAGPGRGCSSACSGLRCWGATAAGAGGGSWAR